MSNFILIFKMSGISHLPVRFHQLDNGLSNVTIVFYSQNNYMLYA